MSQLGQWVGHLAAVVMLAGVAELLMPSGRLAGYARAALGLIVLLAILGPVLTVLHQGVSWAAPDSLVPPSQALPDEAALTRQVFSEMLAARAAGSAEAVAGVHAATATATLGPAAAAGGPPALLGVQVTVQPVNGPGVRDLASRVASHVGADLGLPAARVRVRVQR